MFERPGDLAVSADVGEDEVVNLNAIVGFVAIDADNVPALGSGAATMARPRPPQAPVMTTRRVMAA